MELRSSPKAFEGYTKEDYINTVINVIKEQEEVNPRIKVRFILSINRAASVEDAKSVVDLAIKYKEDKYVVGIEYSGNPLVELFDTFKSEF